MMTQFLRLYKITDLYLTVKRWVIITPLSTTVDGTSCLVKILFESS